MKLNIFPAAAKAARMAAGTNRHGDSGADRHGRRINLLNAFGGGVGESRVCDGLVGCCANL